MSELDDLLNAVPATALDVVESAIIDHQRKAARNSTVLDQSLTQLQAELAGLQSDANASAALFAQKIATKQAQIAQLLAVRTSIDAISSDLTDAVAVIETRRGGRG